LPVAEIAHQLWPDTAVSILTPSVTPEPLATPQPAPAPASAAVAASPQLTPAVVPPAVAAETQSATPPAAAPPQPAPTTTTPTEGRPRPPTPRPEDENLSGEIKKAPEGRPVRPRGARPPSRFTPPSTPEAGSTPAPPGVSPAAPAG